MKLATLALGALAIALSLLVPVVMPDPAPPGSVDQVKLPAPLGGKQRAAAARDTVTPDRRSRRDDRRPRAKARRPGESKASPNARSVLRAEGIRRADATLPAADSPTRRPRNDSAPRAGGSPTPRATPVRDNPPAPGRPAPQGRPVSGPSEPADSPDADATTAEADPPDAPEPADPPDSDTTPTRADSPDEPDLTGEDPLVEAP